MTPCHLTAAYTELDGALYAMQLICSAGGDPWCRDAGNLTPMSVVTRVLDKNNKADPVLDFLKQHTSITKLKPAARQAVLKKKKRDREAKEAIREKQLEIQAEEAAGTAEGDADSGEDSLTRE